MFKRIKDLFNPDFTFGKINRCEICRRVYTDLYVHKGLNCDCGSNRHRLTNASLTEKIKIMFLYIVRGY